MVESETLDAIFKSFADSTRRDILRRVCKSDLTISEIAQPYDMSFAAIAKHVAVLEKGRLVSKRRRGKEQVISANPRTMTTAAAHLQGYERPGSSGTPNSNHC
jgi:DNA-binding transcriptional ArsR family regulator